MCASKKARLRCSGGNRRRDRGIARELASQRIDEVLVERGFDGLEFLRSRRKFRVACVKHGFDIGEVLGLLGKQAAELSRDFGLPERAFVDLIDVESPAFDEPCHIAIGEFSALGLGAAREGLAASFIEVLKIRLGLLAAEQDFGRVGVELSAAEFYRELLEAERMAAFLAGVAEYRSGQNLGPLALYHLAGGELFEVRKCVQPTRVKGWVHGDRTYQIFQAILCWHFKSSTKNLDAIFNSRRRRVRK